MENHLWAPFAIAIVALCARLNLTRLLPETSPFLTLSDTGLSASEDDDDADSSIRVNMSSSSIETSQGSLQKLFSLIRTSKVWKFFQHKELVAVLACFVVKRIGFTSEGLAFQYASEVFNKQLYQTVWL